MSQSVWKIASIILLIFQITQAWEIVCYNRSLGNFKSVTDKNAAELISSGYYDIYKKGVVIASGYRNKMTDDSNTLIINAHLKKYGINVCVINWSKEANFGYIPVLNYPAVVAALLCKVQKELAEWIKNMWQNGMNPKTIHFIGFSLGAQLVAIACRTFTKLTNVTIARVTALDPAKPGFDGDCPIYERIGKDCADLVMGVHTDMYKFGMATIVGHVDFFPNIITYKHTGVQPGCDPVEIIIDLPFELGN